MVRSMLLKATLSPGEHAPVLAISQGEPPRFAAMRRRTDAVGECPSTRDCIAPRFGAAARFRKGCAPVRRWYDVGTNDLPGRSHDPLPVCGNICEHAERQL